MSDKPKKSVAAMIGKVFAVTGKILGTFLLVVILTGLIFACIFANYFKDELSLEADFDYESVTLDETSVIYYIDPKTGKEVPLQSLYGAENRTEVSISQIPKDLQFACVAIEDKRFFDHQGVDWLRTGSASLKMFLGGGSTFGGSTITQQLIKNMTGEREVTVRRKLVEIARALELEKKLSKDAILERYLNTIYLGEGCYGVQSASKVYFGKDVSDLTLAECASLIGITNNPSIYDPYLNEPKNRERQLIILAEMLDQGYIDQAEHDAAVAQKMIFTNSSGQEDNQDDSEYYSYFVDQVIRDVTADLMAKENLSQNFAEQKVRSGGYKIYCTLNPDVQEQMDLVYTDLTNIPETDSLQQLQSGMVIIDNKTGYVVAMVGGVGEKVGSLTLNRATQSRLSPGSTIKPITVYAPALDLGIITPATVYDDTPFSFSDGVKWPKNTDNSYYGLMNISTAVSRSTNTIAVKVLSDVTPEYSFQFAKEKLGMTGLVDKKIINGKEFSDINLAPLALGGLTEGVTIRQMAGAYAAFANKGEFRQPITYSKVINNKGQTILDNNVVGIRAISEKAAWYLTSLLNNAVNSGTGTPAKIPDMAVAGKTGTTTSDQDRWFCGYTPYYTAAVWCGFDEPEEVNLTKSSTNPSAYLWQKVMAAIHTGLPATPEFERPADVVKVSYCRDSGLLATAACKADIRGSRVVSGSLYAEDAPKGSCNVHTMVEMCKESMHVANEFCSQVEGNEIVQVGMLSNVRSFPVPGVYVGDQQYAFYAASDIPEGFYPASTIKDPPGTPCTIHTEESILPPEPEVPEEGDIFVPTDPFVPVDPTQPSDPMNPFDPNYPGTMEPVDPNNPGGTNVPEHGRPDDMGAVPND